MKVVLFCGGFGTRLREHSETIPKPMVCVGTRPILWHLMRYYAHFGHREFILCLGYRGDLIKQYFLNYDECLSNDFVFSRGGRDVPMGNRLTRESLHALMQELARWAKPKRSYRIYLVGGGTAVLEGWRESSIDADLYAQQDDIFRDVQKIKERFAEIFSN